MHLHAFQKLSSNPSDGKSSAMTLNTEVSQSYSPPSFIIASVHAFDTPRAVRTECWLRTVSSWQGKRLGRGVKKGGADVIVGRGLLER